MSGLTDDLVEEILARVPATSLRRLRSTCKQWNSLFNNRRFAKNHFDKAKKQYMDLILRNGRLSWVSVNLHGLHDNIDPSSLEFKDELSLKNLFNNSDNFRVFHCNGFLLCTSRSTTVVWNPCTGQTKWIPTKSANTAYHESALGYVNKKSCHDYKILRYLNHEPFDLEIFDFNSDSWRVSGSDNPDFSLQTAAGMSVKGNTYWLASDNESKNVFLISFNFTTERFKPRVCLPFQGYSCTDTMSLYSVREERLSVLFQNEDAIKTEIWMTNDITETDVMSWSNFLRIDINPFSTSCWGNLDRVRFFIDEENKFAIVSEYVLYEDDTEGLGLYIIGEGRCREVYTGESPLDTYVAHLFCYVPSLVQI